MNTNWQWCHFSTCVELTRSLPSSEDCLSSRWEMYPSVRVMTDAASTTEVRLSFILPTVSPSSRMLNSYKWEDIVSVVSPLRAAVPLAPDCTGPTAGTSPVHLMLRLPCWLYLSTLALPPPDQRRLSIGCCPRVRQEAAAVIGCRGLNRCLAICRHSSSTNIVCAID